MLSSSALLGLAPTGGTSALDTPSPTTPAPQVSARATPYDELFTAAEGKYGLPPGLLRAMAQTESGFNPKAVSPKGAQGLMQFMPATAKRFGIDPNDPAQAVDGAARYLVDLGKRFGGDLTKMVAAYNAGEGAVEKAGGVPNYKETQAYVAKVKALVGSPGAAAAPTQPAGGAPSVGYNPDTGKVYVNGMVFDAESAPGWKASLKEVGKAGTGLPDGFQPLDKDTYAGIVTTATTPNASLKGVMKSLGASVLSAVGAVPYALEEPGYRAAKAAGLPVDQMSRENFGTKLADWMGLTKQSLGDQASIASTAALRQGSILSAADIKKGISEASVGGMVHMFSQGIGSLVPGLAASGISPFLGAAVFSAVAAGSNGQQTYDELMSMSQAKWDQMPEYQTLAKTRGPDAAKKTIADNARSFVMAATAPVGAVDVMLPGASKPAAKEIASIIAKTAKGAVFEAGQETAEGMVQQGATNAATGQALGTDVMQGSLGNAVGGALAGGPVSGTIAKVDNLMLQAQQAKQEAARQVFMEERRRAVAAAAEQGQVGPQMPPSAANAQTGAVDMSAATMGPPLPPTPGQGSLLEEPGGPTAGPTREELQGDPVLQRLHDQHTAAAQVQDEAAKNGDYGAHAAAQQRIAHIIEQAKARVQELSKARENPNQGDLFNPPAPRAPAAPSPAGQTPEAAKPGAVPSTVSQSAPAGPQNAAEAARAAESDTKYQDEVLEGVDPSFVREVARMLAKGEAKGKTAAADILASNKELVTKAKKGAAALDVDSIKELARALRNGGKKAHGPLAPLHRLIQKWDKATSGAGSAKTSKMIEKHIGDRQALAALLQGEFDALVAEFGKKNVEAAIGKIKTKDARLKDTQASGDVRLAMAWDSYTQNRLLSDSLSENPIRYTEEEEAAIAEDLNAHPDWNVSKLEEVMARGAERSEKGGKRYGKTIRSWASRHPGKPKPNEDFHRAVGLLEHIAEHSKDGMARNIAGALIGALHRMGSAPKIVVEKGANPDLPGNRGTYEPATNTIRLYVSGRNEQTILHEMLHGVAAAYIHANYGTDNRFVGRLETLLADLKEAVTGDFLTEYVRSQKLSPEQAVALNNALEEVLGVEGETGIQELLAYGLTDKPFQDLLQFLKVDNITDRAALTHERGKGGAARQTLTLWSKFLDAMSNWLLGRPWNSAKGTMLAQFLSDATALLEEATKGPAPRGKGEVLHSNAASDYAANKAKREAAQAEEAQRRQASAAQAATSSRERTEAMRRQQENRVSMFEGTAPGRTSPLGYLDAAYKALFTATGIPKLTKGAARGLERLSNWAADELPLYRGFLHNTVSGYGLSEAYKSALHTLKAGQVREVSTGVKFFEAFNTHFTEDQQMAVMAALMNPDAIPELSADFTPDQQTALTMATQILSEVVARGVEAGTIPREFADMEVATLLKHMYLKDVQEGKTGLKRSAGIVGLRLQDAGKTVEAANSNVQLSHTNRYVEVMEQHPNGTDVRHFVPAETADQALAAMRAKGMLVEFSDGKHVWREAKGKATEGRAVMYRAFESEEMKQAGLINDPRYTFHATVHHLMQDIMHAEMFNFIHDYGSVDHGERREQMSFASQEEAQLHAEVHGLRPQDWVEVPSTRSAAGQKKFGALAGRWIPKSVWNDMTASVDNRPVFGRTYQEWLTKWKLAKTVFSPVTHFNNVASNFALAFYRDVPAGNIIKAAKIYRDLYRGTAEEKETAKRAIEEFDSSGANIGSHAANEQRHDQMMQVVDALLKQQNVDDSPAALMKIMEAVEWAKASRAGRGARWVSDKSKAAYAGEDNIFRLAAYITHIQNGKSVSEAGKLASSDFVDYHITAPWINKLRGSVLPFVAWPYRMIPAMIGIAIEKPWKFATMVTALYGVNALGYALAAGDEDEERKFLPEYQKGRLGGVLPVPKLIRMPGSNTFLDASAAFPLGDILAMDNDGFFGMPWLRTFTPSGPLIILAEALFGYDSFKGEKLTKDTNSAVENVAAVAKHTAQQALPNLPYPGSRQFDTMWDLLRDRHGITGAEYSRTLKLLSLIGPKLTTSTLEENKAIQGIAVNKLYRDYTAEMRRVNYGEARYGTPDWDKAQARIKDLNDRYLQKVEELQKP